ncbi:MAG: serine/threonine-protein kinase [Anaerotardibacter sp.]
MSKLILNRYKPIVEAGAGGFASVIVAWDTNLERSVAIKCISLQGMFSQAKDDRYSDALDSLERKSQSFPVPDFISPFRKGGSDTEEGSQEGNFSQGRGRNDGKSVSLLTDAIASSIEVPGLEEARTAAQLNDQNIVSVHDFQIQGDMAYLIMEYIEGLSLADLLRQYRNEIDADVVAALFKAVSHALEVAHKNKILHLDIKPDNVLIARDGQIKVVDFGLARLAGENGFGIATGGTIGYMPPEQMNQEELDQRCDVWALASLFYEVISGSNPFKVARLEDAEDAIYGAEIVIPSLCMEGIDEAIDDIMFCALDPNRDNRYNSVKAFAKEMKPCLGNAAKGKKKLAQMVSENYIDTSDSQDDEEEEQGNSGLLGKRRKSQEDYAGEGVHIRQEEDYSSSFVPFLERMRPLTKTIALRVWAVLSAALLGAVSLSNFPLLEGGWYNPWVGGLLVSLVVFVSVFPRVGTLVALELFGVFFIAQSAWITGILVMIFSLLWWFFEGRFSLRQCCVVLSPALFGAVGLACLVPLLAGYMSRLKDALASGGCSLLITFALASLGSLSLTGWDAFSFMVVSEGVNLNAHMMNLVIQPATWLFAAAWMIACALGGFACSRFERVGAFLGLLAGEVLIIAALVVGALVLPDAIGSSASFVVGSEGSVNTFAILSAVTSGVIMSVIVYCFGVPEPEFDEIRD